LRSDGTLSYRDTIVDRIDLLLDRVAEVCPLPRTAQRLLELTASERTSIPEVARLIATDPALAAAVLRIANSAVFGGGNVDRLETAVMRMGLRELHDMAAAMSLFAAFRNRGELLVNLHDHSVVAGAVAHRLAKTLGGVQANVAFTSGLLSEIGAMACLSVDGKEYSQIWRAAQVLPEERNRLERERYGGSSYLIGGRFLTRHRLPEPLCQAVATEADADLGAVEPLGRILVLARVSAVIMLFAGKTGDRAVAVERMQALPESLRGASLSGEQLFETCVQAGATAEQALRTGR
jgi:HD-like signal output (HDOD) protein